MAEGDEDPRRDTLEADEGLAPGRLVPLQRASLWIAGAAFLLVLAASGGCQVLPAGIPSLAWVLHPAVLLLGFVAGWLTTLRHREIDGERWRVVADPLLTKGEREYAHKEAEAERRRAAVCFIAAPLLLAWLLASRFRGPGSHLVTDLLAVTTLAGYGAGLAWGELRGRGAQRR